jgi:ankyrin repeat protein
VKPLPSRANLEHLKKQAKDLLRGLRAGDAAALARFRLSLPAAAGQTDALILSLGLRLHDAQSCLAREYGFASWDELRTYVAVQVDATASAGERVMRWLRLVYAGDVAGSNRRSAPGLAERVLAEQPDLVGNDPYLACAVGEETVLVDVVRKDPDWLNRPGGPLALPPLVAVTHSSLIRLPAFTQRLHRCARLLLDFGADPNQSIGSRSPPASLEAPSAQHPLSALYGAAGANHDAEMTAVLLNAGADPNDGESLYHSLENPACTRLLLAAGARIEGSNAFYRAFDLDDPALIELLLSFGANPNEPPLGQPTVDFGSPLLWAIKRRRSVAHIDPLLRAGADPHAKTVSGVSAYRLARQFGLSAVADLLRQRGAGEDLSLQEQFVAACASADEPQARHLLGAHPGLLATLSDAELRLLPDLAAEGAADAVRLMVRLGWPIAVKGGDIQGSALNCAVFRGDADLARFLLEHGARWTERHGFGSNVCGTLAWASCNRPVEGGDWLGCAEALVAHGMPRASALTPEGALVIGRGRYEFSADVSRFLQEP